MFDAGQKYSPLVVENTTFVPLDTVASFGTNPSGVRTIETVILDS
jgi:hypothetical protein